MRKIRLTGICLLLVLTGTAQARKEPVKVTDLLKIKTISGVTLSNDGSKAACIVTAIEPDNESKTDYKYVTQLWLVPAEGTCTPRQLSGKENASQAAWSPDGQQLAFVRTADGKPQLFLLSLNGGEAQQLTRFKYGATAPQWSADGKKILFAAGVPLKDLLDDSLLNAGKPVPAWPAEKPGFEKNEFLQPAAVKADPDGNLDAVRAYLDMNVADKKARVFNKLNFQDENNITPDIVFTHLFIVAATPGAIPMAITHGYSRYNSANLTPDGKQVVFSGNNDTLQHPDRALETALFIANTDGSGFRTLLSEKGKSYSGPKLSPSGKWLAFQSSPSASFVNFGMLSIMPLNGTEKDRITIPLDRAKLSYNWSPDDNFLYFTAQSNGGTVLYRFDRKTRQVLALTDVNSGISSFDVTNNKVVFAKTAVADPSELYGADGSARNERRLTQFNNWVQKKQLSIPEKNTFTNSKGLTIEYWVMKPANYEPGKKYPLLLEIHGGPSAMWGPGEGSMWHEFQFFCSKGYGVVYCNPRGSGGYGEDFLRANINDWGAGPTGDVLTALDKTVAEGWADTAKLAVTGGSYAGYLVAWIIAHDHRFKAACSQRGVYDLATFFGEGNAWRLVPNYFGGYPWEPTTKAILERESPINYVQNITTPYIIFHGDNDRRTGFVQSEMLYRSLKVLERPVEYVRHPNATHEITRSGDNRQRIDQLLRTWEFFERYIPAQ